MYVQLQLETECLFGYVLTLSLDENPVLFWMRFVGAAIEQNSLNALCIGLIQEN